jgi:hypothetical protein
MEYFPHDTDAVNDEKIEALRMLYGNDGYAFYFILLERIYRDSSFELDVSDAETRQILAKKIAISEEKFDQMLSTALNRGLFNKEDYEEFGILSSFGIKKRAKIVVDKREKMRQRYENKDSKVLQAETPPEMPQSKVKESKSKVKVNKVQYAEFVHLTSEEYEKLVNQYGQEMTARCIDILNNYKGASGKKYKSDYMATLNWVVDRATENRRDRKPSNVTPFKTPNQKQVLPIVQNSPEERKLTPKELEELEALKSKLRSGQAR